MTISILVHFYAMDKLFRIVEEEQPNWLSVEGHDTLFFGVPGQFNLIVRFRLLSVAFSQRLGQLAAPSARVFGLTVRASLVVALAAIIALEYLTWGVQP